MFDPVCLAQLRAFYDPYLPLVTCLGNMLAVCYWQDPAVNWAGLYYLDPQSGDFYLGEFQGKPACTIIAKGKGIIGRCAACRKAVIIEDVLQEKDHIACDAASRSELVIPLFQNDQLTAVLDLDASITHAFDDCHEAILQELQKLFSGVCCSPFAAKSDEKI